MNTFLFNQFWTGKERVAVKVANDWPRSWKYISNGNDKGPMRKELLKVRVIDMKKKNFHLFLP